MKLGGQGVNGWDERSSHPSLYMSSTDYHQRSASRTIVIDSRRRIIRGCRWRNSMGPGMRNESWATRLSSTRSGGSTCESGRSGSILWRGPSSVIPSSLRRKAGRRFGRSGFGVGGQRTPRHVIHVASTWKTSRRAIRAFLVFASELRR